MTDVFIGIGVPVNESVQRDRVAMHDEPALIIALCLRTRHFQ